MPDLTTEGIKYDDGKNRLELIPPEAIWGLGEVLTFGAKKYSKSSLGKLWELVAAERISLYIAGVCAGHVTKNNSGKIILSMPSGKDKMPEIGPQETVAEFWSWPELEKRLLGSEIGIKELNSSHISGNSDSPKNLITSSWAEVVKFVGQNSTYTLITTIQQGGSEVFYAVSTTTVSGSLVTMLKALRPLLPISSLNPETGDRNWEKGMKWSRLFGASLRHLWKWWWYKAPDEETGYSHLKHALCCIAFLVAYEERKVGEDDRP